MTIRELPEPKQGDADDPNGMRILPYTIVYLLENLDAFPASYLPHLEAAVERLKARTNEGKKQ
jgi:hypothetical protein